jgi:hypothetical protein
MIYVRVELWPLGFREKAKVLGEAFITNTGRGNKNVGHYTYRINGKLGRHMSSGEVTGFPRQRLHMWDLLKRVLVAARHIPE